MSRKYLKSLSSLFPKIAVSDDREKSILLDTAVKRIVDFVLLNRQGGMKVFCIGNGGSASIANHIATDFIKNAATAALSFSDSSLLTCISNDLGYERVFEEPLGALAKKGDALFSISSSGASKNILNATLRARKKGLFVVTLSGFHEGNPLRKLGEVNFYLPSYSYGYVEIIHLALCHCIVEEVMKKNKHGQI